MRLFDNSERPKGTPVERARQWRLGVEAEGREKGLAEGQAKGRAEGLAEGLAKGLAVGEAHQRALLRRQAERKFGTETANRLHALMSDIADSERLAEIGDWIIDSENGTELLENVQH